MRKLTEKIDIRTKEKSPFTKQPSSNKLYHESGEIKDSDRLTLFLYLLMRDNLPTGVVEQIVMNTENALATPDTMIAYSNGYLVGYAKNLAERLKAKK